MRGSSLVRRTVSAFGACLSLFGMRVPWTTLLAVIFLIGSAVVPVEAKGKVRLGAVENGVLLPWGVLMPARIDTGAATS